VQMRVYVWMYGKVRGWVYACVSGEMYWGTSVVKRRNGDSDRIVRLWFVLRKAGYGILD
jgi:hypothetical protein